MADTILLATIVTFTDHSRNESRQEIHYPNSKEKFDEPRFTVTWYVNGENTYTISTLPASQVYDISVHPESILPVEGNRWHVIMRHQAMTRMLHCNMNESFTLCFQDPHVNPEMDTEMIIVTRDYEELLYE